MHTFSQKQSFRWEEPKGSSILWIWNVYRSSFYVSAVKMKFLKKEIGLWYLANVRDSPVWMRKLPATWLKRQGPKWGLCACSVLRWTWWHVPHWLLRGRLLLDAARGCSASPGKWGHGSQLLVITLCLIEELRCTKYGPSLPLGVPHAFPRKTPKNESSHI